MSSCELSTNSIDIVNGNYTFKASGSTIKFDGFMKYMIIKQKKKIMMYYYQN